MVHAATLMGEPVQQASAEFYLSEPEPDEKATAEAGAPRFRTVEMVRITWAADTKRELCAPATDYSDRYDINPDRSRRRLTWIEAFPAQYERFRKGQDQRPEGVPLGQMFTLTPARRRELEALNIWTVEQLASLEGSLLARVGMDGRKLKQAAQDLLKSLAGQASDIRLQAEIEKRDAEMAELRKQLEALTRQRHRAPAVADEDEEPAGPNPFESFDDDDIRNWLKDSGAPVDGRWGRTKLLAEAAKRNEELRRQREGA